MKRLMFMLIFLLVIPFCKAADPDESWYQAVADIPNWQEAQELNLTGKAIYSIPEGLNLPYLRHLLLMNNYITDFPEDFTFPNLMTLFLGNNLIEELDPAKFTRERLPNLARLDVSINPISQENAAALRELLMDRQAVFGADHIGEDVYEKRQHPSAIKPVKRGK